MPDEAAVYQPVKDSRTIQVWKREPAAQYGNFSGKQKSLRHLTGPRAQRARQVEKCAMIGARGAQTLRLADLQPTFGIIRLIHPPIAHPACACFSFPLAANINLSCCGWMRGAQGSLVYSSSASENGYAWLTHSKAEQLARIASLDKL